MKTDRIDLYQMHHIDRTCPFDEIWQAMETLVAQGKIVYVGSSNFAGWDIATANQTAARRNFVGLVCEQSIYNLENRHIALEVIPACRHYGLGLIPWSPLGGGILGGVLAKQKSGQKTRVDEKAQLLEKRRPQIEKYEALCREMGEEPANVALAWLLHNPVVTAPIIGPRTIDQLTGMLKVPEMKLADDVMKKLDEIWPGPGGEAPNAYAW
jgi:aryl-alcohol dehydrogenase-like predicted oxidoreductase